MEKLKIKEKFDYFLYKLIDQGNVRTLENNFKIISYLYLTLNYSKNFIKPVITHMVIA